MLRQRVVLRAGRAAEMVERKAEAAIDIGLQRMLGIAIAADLLARFDGAELGRGAVLVGAADEQHLVAELAAEARVHVRRQQRADEIAEMLDAVDVGQRTGDQNLAHDTSVRERERLTRIEKPFRAAEGLGSWRMPRAIGRASTLPAGSPAVGPGHSCATVKRREGHVVLPKRIASSE